MSMYLVCGMFPFCIASIGMTCNIFISRIRENTIEMPNALFPATFMLQLGRVSSLLIRKEKAKKCVLVNEFFTQCKTIPAFTQKTFRKLIAVLFLSCLMIKVICDLLASRVGSESNVRFCWISE